MTTLPTDKRAAAYGEQRMNHLQAAGYIVENGDGMSNAEPQAICRDERDALDAPAEAGGRREPEKAVPRNGCGLCRAANRKRP